MTEPMTDAELKQMRERVDAATPGPWREHVTCVGSDGVPPDSDVVCCRPQDTSHERIARWYRDKAFIAHARTDMPRLLDEVERLRAENAALRAKLEQTFTEDWFLNAVTELINP